MSEKLTNSPSEGKRTPREQGSNVPLGFTKPTLSRPLPAVRCTGKIRSGPRKGEPCENWSMVGASVCFRHGGNLPNVKQAAEDRKAAARLAIIDAAGDAVETIEYLARFAVQENVKLAAAKDLLDRAGIKGGADITIEHQHTLAPSQVLAEKLSGMFKSIEAEKNKEFTQAADPDIIDVEVIPAETNEQDTETNE